MHRGGNVEALLHLTFDQVNCNRREHTSGSPSSTAKHLTFNNRRKIDADFQAAREEQNWYSKLSVKSNSDSIFA